MGKVKQEEITGEREALARDAGGAKCYSSDHCLMDDGSEYCGGGAVEIPARLKRVQNMRDEVQRVVREELSRLKSAEGYETFEEADDFDCGDDDEIRTAYELDDEVPYEYGNEGRSGREEEPPRKRGKQADQAIRGRGEEAEDGEEGDRGDERQAGEDAPRQPVTKKVKKG